MTNKTCPCGKTLTTKTQVGKNRCGDCIRKWVEKYRARYPWKTSLGKARERCESKNNADYWRYGGKGIKFHLTDDEGKALWLRDRAEEMEKPSIDRIDSKLSYEFSNCRFVELRYNCSRARGEQTMCWRGHPYTSENIRVHPETGHRRCVVCQREYNKKVYAAIRAKGNRAGGAKP